MPAPYQLYFFLAKERNMKIFWIFVIMAIVLYVATLFVPAVPAMICLMMGTLMFVMSIIVPGEEEQMNKKKEEEVSYIELRIVGRFFLAILIFIFYPLLAPSVAVVEFFLEIVRPPKEGG